MLYSELMDTICATSPDFSEFRKAIVSSRKQAKFSFRTHIKQTTIDIGYKRLHTVRRRAERRARGIKSADDLRTAGTAQKKIRQHFKKLNRKRWRSFSTSIVPRKPTCFIWRIARTLSTTPHEYHSFRAIVLSNGRQEIQISEEYCTHLTG